MKSEVYKRNLDTADEMYAGILYAAGCVKKRENQDERNEIFEHESRIALRLTGGYFGNIYCGQ